MKVVQKVGTMFAITTFPASYLQMAINTLSDKDCREATNNAGKLKKYFDGHGMYLAVLPTGSKVWRLAYRTPDGKPKTATIGPYPLISLKDARVRRDALRLKLLDGVDLTAKVRVAESPILSKVIADYWATRKDISEGYRNNAMRALAMHIEPLLGAIQVHNLTRENLMDALRPMDAAGKSVYVRKTRMWVSQVLDWAVEQGYCSDNPAASIKAKVAFSREPVKGFASLPVREVHAFMERLAVESDLNSVLACRLMALTWTRTKELRGMVWSEIEGDLWRIPASRMKGEREHLVPLSKQALGIIEQMRQRSTGSRYVFPNDRTKERSMSENAVLYLIQRIGYQDRMTGHGWRKVGSTWANENEYNRDHIEMQLAHVDSGVRGIYNSAEYLKQRRVMLQAYADWLLKSESDASGMKS